MFFFKQTNTLTQQKHICAKKCLYKLITYAQTYYLRIIDWSHKTLNTQKFTYTSLQQYTPKTETNHEYMTQNEYNMLRQYMQEKVPKMKRGVSTPHTWRLTKSRFQWRVSRSSVSFCSSGRTFTTTLMLLPLGSFSFSLSLLSAIFRFVSCADYANTSLGGHINRHWFELPSRTGLPIGVLLWYSWWWTLE